MQFSLRWLLLAVTVAAIAAGLVRAAPEWGGQALFNGVCAIAATGLGKSLRRWTAQKETVRAPIGCVAAIGAWLIVMGYLQGVLFVFAATMAVFEMLA